MEVVRIRVVLHAARNLRCAAPVRTTEIANGLGNTLGYPNTGRVSASRPPPDWRMRRIRRRGSQCHVLDMEREER